MKRRQMLKTVGGTAFATGISSAKSSSGSTSLKPDSDCNCSSQEKQGIKIDFSAERVSAEEIYEQETESLNDTPAVWAEAVKQAIDSGSAIIQGSVHLNEHIVVDGVTYKLSTSVSGSTTITVPHLFAEETDEPVTMSINDELDEKRLKEAVAGLYRREDVSGLPEHRFGSPVYRSLAETTFPDTGEFVTQLDSGRYRFTTSEFEISAREHELTAEKVGESVSETVDEIAVDLLSTVGSTSKGNWPSLIGAIKSGRVYSEGFKNWSDVEGLSSFSGEYKTLLKEVFSPPPTKYGKSSYVTLGNAHFRITAATTRTGC